MNKKMLPKAIKKDEKKTVPTTQEEKYQDEQQINSKLTKAVQKEQGYTDNPVHLINEQFLTRFNQGMEKRVKNQFKGEEGEVYESFSRTLIGGGQMASAIIKGEAKPTFITCLKRNLTQDITLMDRNERVTNQFAHVELSKFTEDSVGLVLDNIHESKRVLEIMEQLTQEETIFHKMYPFLHMEEEEELLVAYEAKLAELKEQQADPTHIRIIESGIHKTKTLMAKKQQLKHTFHMQLQYLLMQLEKARQELQLTDILPRVMEELKDIIGEEGGEPDEEGDTIQ